MGQEVVADAFWIDCDAVWVESRVGQAAEGLLRQGPFTGAMKGKIHRRWRFCIVSRR